MTATNDDSKPQRKFIFIRLVKVPILVMTIFGLGLLNIITLTNENAHTSSLNFLKTVLSPLIAEATMSRLLRDSPTEKYKVLEKKHRSLESKHLALEKNSLARSKLVKDIGTRISKRTIANAAKNVTAYAAEVIPFVGVSVITALTISDLYDDCQTLKEINQLSIAFEHKPDDENTVCGINFRPKTNSK